MITKSTRLHLDNYQRTEHSHLLEHGSHEAKGQAQHCLCKESLCFKKNVCTIIKVLALAPCHPKGTISWTLGFLWTSDSLEEEEVLPHHNQKRRRAAHTKFIKRATKTGVLTLKCRDSFFLPPCKESRLKEEPQGPFTGSSSVCSTSSDGSNEVS